MLVKADTLERWQGEPLDVTIDTANLVFEDGRSEVKSVQPYVVKRKFPINIEALWGPDELLAIGLSRVIRCVVPEGYELDGVPTLKREGNVVREWCQFKKLPPPPAEVTISVEEHQRLVADAEKWRLQSQLPPGPIDG